MEHEFAIRANINSSARAETGWEQEREAYFTATSPVHASENQPDMANLTDPVLGNLVRDVAALAYNMERINDVTPVVDAATRRPHRMDKKDREKRIALGQRADDEPTYNQTMHTSW